MALRKTLIFVHIHNYKYEFDLNRNTYKLKKRNVVLGIREHAYVLFTVTLWRNFYATKTHSFVIITIIVLLIMVHAHNKKRRMLASNLFSLIDFNTIVCTCAKAMHVGFLITMVSSCAFLPIFTWILANRCLSVVSHVTNFPFSEQIMDVNTYEKCRICVSK